jgi:uncharacterized protein YcbX
MPDGVILDDDPDASRTLSDFMRREVRLERVRREPITPGEREAIMSGDMLPPARDFFDEEVVHLIATGTLAHLRALSGGASDFDPRRFRANIIVDTGADTDGFVEDGWLDGTLEVGDTARIVGMRPALRCAITTHRRTNYGTTPPSSAPRGSSTRPTPASSRRSAQRAQFGSATRFS